MVVRSRREVRRWSARQAVRDVEAGWRGDRQRGEEVGVQPIGANRALYCSCFLGFGSHVVMVSLYCFLFSGKIAHKIN